MSGNLLPVLPAMVGQLVEARILHFSRNRIGEQSGGQLPAEIGSCQKLQELFIDSNEIVDLPLELGLLTNLETLHLDIPKLKSPPQEILVEGTGRTLGYLRRLCDARSSGYLDLSTGSLGHRGLLTFPPQLLQLTELHTLLLTDNRLEELPLEIQDIKRLTCLDLAGNVLRSLPRTMVVHTELTSLDLRNKGSSVSRFG